MKLAPNNILVTVNDVSSSARKVRMVINPIRSKSAKDAISLLRSCPRKELAITVTKAINSGLDRALKSGRNLEDMVVDAIWADEGPTLKRFRPRAQGRAFKIRHRTSSIKVVLNEKRPNSAPQV